MSHVTIAWYYGWIFLKKINSKTHMLVTRGKKWKTRWGPHISGLSDKKCGPTCHQLSLSILSPLYSFSLSPHLISLYRLWGRRREAAPSTSVPASRESTAPGALKVDKPTMEELRNLTRWRQGTELERRIWWRVLVGPFLFPSSLLPIPSPRSRQTPPPWPRPLASSLSTTTTSRSTFACEQRWRLEGWIGILKS